MLRFDDGTTANDPACGAYDAVIVVLFDDTFVVIDDVFVVMDCKTAAELTAIEPPDVTAELTKIKLNIYYQNRLIIFFPLQLISQKRKKIIQFTSIVVYTAHIDNVNNCIKE